jgi:hypothetical protein
MKNLSKSESLNLLGKILTDLRTLEEKGSYADDFTAVTNQVRHLYEAHCREEGVSCDNPPF